MHEVLAVALTSMQQDMSRLDRVASNLANVSTPGFKREVLVGSSFGDAFSSALAETRTAPAATGLDSSAGPVVMTDSRAGSVRVTGQPFDLAIEGDGFFEVMTVAGPAYTRQGDFQVDARGRLVTSRGEPVMGVSGEITLTTLKPTIDSEGRVTEPLAAGGPGSGSPTTAVGQLKVVHLDDLQFVEGKARIRQGALENSNVSSAQEMVQLMQTMRHFEAMQKVAQGYDEMLGAAIRKLGDL
jgi:flagellar basal-body rod protein FlgF